MASYFLVDVVEFVVEAELGALLRHEVADIGFHVESVARKDILDGRFLGRGDELDTGQCGFLFVVEYRNLLRDFDGGVCRVFVVQCHLEVVNPVFQAKALHVDKVEVGFRRVVDGGAAEVVFFYVCD